MYDVFACHYHGHQVCIHRISRSSNVRFSDKSILNVQHPQLSLPIDSEPALHTSVLWLEGDVLDVCERRDKIDEAVIHSLYVTVFFLNYDSASDYEQ